MNKTRLYVAIMASLPFAAFSLGMGDMTVESSLNQPFKAEIQLIDVDIPLAGVKARLASVEDFARIGLDRNEILTLLRFEIRKNGQGQPVILISSNERIVEPFLEIVVDLTWANGQLYRAYTVLLDPPGYQLNGGVKATGSPVKLKTYASEPGVVDKPSYAHVVEQGSESGKLRKEATYGPTVANENIWQIAQRYTTPDTTIQQVILAIVGTNSQAFTQGNLNGLKTGERLRIPSSDEVKKVPEELARGEVEAHDLAWRNKEEIKHVLLPPYIDGVAGTSQFETKSESPPLSNAATGESPSNIPQAPVFNQQKTTPGKPLTDIFSTASSLMSAEDSKKPVTTDKQPVKTDSALKAEMDVTNAAIDSMRLVNSQLKNQLQSLEKDNKALQEQMSKRDEDIRQLREQMALLLKQRQAIAAQASQMPAEEESSSLWLYLLLILVAAGVGTFTWFFLKQKTNRRNSLSEPDGHPQDHTPPEPVKPLLQAKAVEAERTDDDTASTVVETNALSEAVKTPVDKPTPNNALTIHQAAIEPAVPSLEPTTSLQTDEDEAVISSGVNEAVPEELPERVIENQAPQDDPLLAEPQMSIQESEEPLAYELTDEPAGADPLEKTEKTAEKKEYKRPLSDLLKTTSDYPVEVVGINNQAHEAIEPLKPDEEPAPMVEETSESEHSALDFEPSLEKMVEENKQKQTVSEDVEHPVDEGLDFIPTPIEAKTEEKAAVVEVDAGDDHALEFEAGLHYEPAGVEPEKADSQTIESPEIDELLKADGDEDEGPVINFDSVAEEGGANEAKASALQPETEKKSKKATKANMPDEDVIDTIALDVSDDESIAFDTGDDGDNEFNFEAEFSSVEPSADMPQEIVEMTGESEEPDDSSAGDKKLVKSKKALDTLMALAKTYLSMDDHEAAKQSLQEIVEFGNKKQRTEAQKLLDDMDKK